MNRYLLKWHASDAVQLKRFRKLRPVTGRSAQKLSPCDRFKKSSTRNRIKQSCCLIKLLPFLGIQIGAVVSARHDAEQKTKFLLRLLQKSLLKTFPLRSACAMAVQIRPLTSYSMYKVARAVPVRARSGRAMKNPGT